jgi:hypothetical protein
VTHTNFPVAMAWTCVWNDLIWWGPFTVILLRVMANCNSKRLSVLKPEALTATHPNQ